MNSVNLTGRIATELELRTSKKGLSPEGTNFLTFLLAIRTVSKGEDGKNKPMFVKCVAFRTNAELIMLYCRKGNLVGVPGSLVPEICSKQSPEQYGFKVIVDKVSFLESKKEEAKLQGTKFQTKLHELSSKLSSTKQSSGL